MAKNHFGANLPIWPSPAPARPAQARLAQPSLGQASQLGGRANICPAGICLASDNRGGPGGNLPRPRGRPRGRESNETCPWRPRIQDLGWSPGKSGPSRDLPGLRCFAEAGQIPARHKSARLPIPERWPEPLRAQEMDVSRGIIEGQSQSHFQLFLFFISLHNNSPSATLDKQTMGPM